MLIKIFIYLFNLSTVATRMFKVRYYYREVTYTIALNLPLTNEPTLLMEVIKAIQAREFPHPRYVDYFTPFILQNEKSSMVISTSALIENEILDFYCPQVIDYPCFEFILDSKYASTIQSV